MRKPVNAPLRLRRDALQLLHKAGVLAALRCAACLVCGFVLSAASLQNGPLPLAACFLAFLELGGDALLAGAGAAAGYLHFWGLETGMEPAAGVVVTLIALALFSGTELNRLPWFFPGVTAAVFACLGTVFLLSQRAIAAQSLGMFFLRTGLAALGAKEFAQLRRNRTPGAMLFAVWAAELALAQILTAGCLDLGVAAAAALVCGAPEWGLSLPVAAAAGLALDFAQISGVLLTPVLCLSAVSTALLRKRWGRRMGPALWSLPAMLLTGEVDLMVPLSLTVGGILSLAIPARAYPIPVRSAPETMPELSVQLKLETAAEILGQVQSALLQQSLSPLGSRRDPTASLFDQAAEQICRRCPMWKICWDREAEDTYRWLSAAAPGILKKGTAEQEDLPPAFAARCRCADDFLAAVNQALLTLRCRRQCSEQIRESRQAVCVQYQFLARYLADTAAELEQTPVARQARYRPVVGIRSVGKYGAAACGDRGACFPGPGGRYYVLLCDGMGTGLGAAQESEGAVRVLSGLLRAGLPAAGALEMLNALYVLRESGGFATADLLELHLDTGRALLYKWGAAPSYLKQRRFAKRIGTAAPPPGLGVGGVQGAETIRLSLQREEAVVLVSDGVSGESARDIIAAYQGGSMKELADQLISGAEAEGEDDRTAVAVCLRPASAG